MHFKQLVLTAVCVVSAASFAVAKEKKHEKQMDPQAMMEEYKKLATPGEPHKQLAGLAGNWTTKTKEWMEPGKPPTEATGTAEMKMVPDGKTITMKGQHPKPDGGQMTHRAVWKIVDGNNQIFEMYGTHDHGKEMKMMEIEYTRKQ
jgi:hypothetical protein